MIRNSIYVTKFIISILCKQLKYARAYRYLHSVILVRLVKIMLVLAEQEHVRLTLQLSYLTLYFNLKFKPSTRETEQILLE